MRWGIRAARLLGILIGGLAGVVPITLASGSPPRPELTHAQQVRSLSSQEAHRHYPVHLRGVLTYADSDWNLVFLQDSTAGIFLLATAVDADLRLGQYVEVEGDSEPGGFAPVVRVRHTRHRGRVSLPVPRRARLSDMVAGRMDSRWVEAEGIVHSLRRDRNHLILQVFEAGYQFAAMIDDVPAGSPLPSWVDARVRIQGVCAAAMNGKGQLVGFQLFVPRLSDVRVEAPGPRDPYVVPARPIGRLVPSAQRDTGGHRVHVRGTITFTSDGIWGIQDTSGGAYIETAPPAGVKPGDEVDAVAFVSPGQYAPVLKEVLVRRRRREMSWLRPRPITVQTAESGRADAQAVQMDAELLDAGSYDGHRILIVRASGSTFKAYLMHRDTYRLLEHLLPGSLLRLTGVCMAQVGDGLSLPRFRMALRTPADVIVLLQPPWWTQQRAWMALKGLAGIAMAVLGWALFLIYRLRLQGSLLRGLEREAALEERYRSLFGNATEMVWTQDGNGALTALNPAGEAILGPSWRNLQAEGPVARVGDAFGEPLCDWAKRLATESGAVSREIEIVTWDRRRAVLEISLRRIGSTEEPAGFEGIARDITARRRAEEALRQSEERFRALVRNASDVIAILDRDGSIRYVSPAAERVWGYQTVDLLGWKLDRLALPADAGRVEALVAQACAAAEGIPSGEIRVRHADGSLCYCEILLSNQLSEPGVDGLVLTGRDVTERRMLQDELAHQAFHDPLTGLPNRALFMDRLTQALAETRRHGGGLAVLFIDLDDFKAINDSQGHAAGDALLLAVAGRLRQDRRAEDTLARLGGDEFTLLLPDVTDPAAAQVVAERILADLEAPFALDGCDVCVAASIGIAIAHDPHGTPESLLCTADAAMYAAKGRGKMSYAFIEPSSAVRFPAVHELQQAL